MIVWGGSNGSGFLNTGREIQSRHRQLDSYQHQPTRRSADRNFTAVWTGSEMIVWGGFAGAYLNTGGRYNPIDGQLDCDQYHQRAQRPNRSYGDLDR